MNNVKLVTIEDDPEYSGCQHCVFVDGQYPMFPDDETKLLNLACVSLPDDGFEAEYIWKEIK